MDPKHEGAGMLLAPGAPSSAASTYVFPGRDRSVVSESTPGPSAFPRVDERLVKPETREIMIRGERMLVEGADEEHADAHACLDFLLLPHVRQENTTSSDLLTRASHASDFATDASVRKAGKDPLTGSRYLEEISFEIINEQSMAHARRKAEDLSQRGVRRVFAIFVKKGVVCEWAKTTKEFVTLGIESVIDDPALIRPISVRALLDRTQAEIDVVRVLDKKNNPEIVRLKEEADLNARRLMLRELLEDAFGTLPVSTRTRLETASVEQLRSWTKKLRHVKTLVEVFGDDPKQSG
ncbi:MAG TPA: hypothetical protein PK156_11245 [Polyangium sp.]|nr:hypothetical protein [Polyangium sp.]